MSAKDPKQEPSTDKPQPQEQQERAKSAPLPKLDFARLDLSIEKIEERISPGETNVFDK